MAVLWALLGAVLVALYLLGTQSFAHFRRQNVPFDRPLPFLGNMWPALWKRVPSAEYIKGVYDRLRPGNPVIGFFEFLKPVYIVCDPEIIKCITTKDAEYFPNHRSSISKDVDPIVGSGLVSLEGEQWKSMRTTLSPSFTASKMRAMSVLVAECGRQMADHVQKRCEAAEGGTLSLELKDLFTRYANDVIATCAFGVRVDSLEETSNEFYEMGKTASDITLKRMLVFIGYTFAPSIMKKLGYTLLPGNTSNFFRTLVHETIAAREQHNIVRPDMIHLLMQARDTADPPLTEDDITGQAFLFFLAGFDVSSTNLSFLCHLLAAHPDVQTRAQREVDKILAAHGGELTWEALHEMKYLDMIMSETLRLYPPSIMTDRKCVKPYVLEGANTQGGLRLNEGDGIWVPIFALHRDPEYFPEPDRFDPDRFSEQRKHDIRPYTYLPFGAGPRNCIGMRFALMETKMAAVSLLSRFDLVPVEKTVLPLQLDKRSFGMAAEGGFWIGFKPRALPERLFPKGNNS